MNGPDEEFASIDSLIDLFNDLKDDSRLVF